MWVVENDAGVEFQMQKARVGPRHDTRIRQPRQGIVQCLRSKLVISFNSNVQALAMYIHRCTDYVGYNADRMGKKLPTMTAGLIQVSHAQDN